MNRIEIAALLMAELAKDVYFGTVSEPYNPWPGYATESLRGADELLKQADVKKCFHCGHGAEHHKHADACRYEDCQCKCFE